MAEQSYLEVPHLTRREIARFFSKVQRDPVSGCWNWVGAKINGYGTFWYHSRNESTHRLTFAWLVQPLPRGLGARKPVLDHVVCENPACCNPSHLRLCLNVENLERTRSVSAVNRRKTHCLNGHPLPDRPNRWNGYGRTCVTCNNDRQREAKRVQRALAKRRLHTPSGVPTTDVPNP